MTADTRNRPPQGAAPEESGGHHTTTTQRTRRVSYCPPGCATVCAWPADVRLDGRWPASTELLWTLVGLGTDPLPHDRWSAVIDAVERAAGPLAVARGLDLAARQPSMVPPEPVTAASRWWTDADRQRAGALAEVYRSKAEGVIG